MSKHDKPADKHDVARSIWLAGLGAYGRAFDEAVNRYEKASKDSPKLFKDLVKRGQALEKEARSKVNQSDLARTTTSLEDRLKRVRANLSFGPGAIRDDLERLEGKIDALASQLDALVPASPGNMKAASKKRVAAKKAPTGKAASRSRTKK